MKFYSWCLCGVIFTYLSWHVRCGTVYKTIIKDGTGPVPQVNQMVTVHYNGTLPSGKKFDSSYDRNEPFKFKLGVGEVIRGWDAGVSSMRVGEKARLEIAPEDAYGAEGLPPVIPPRAKLVFIIELLEVDGVPAHPAPDRNRYPVEIPGTNPQRPQDFPTSGQGQGQTVNSGSNQGRIFTPPDLPNFGSQGQQFPGSTIRQDEVFVPTGQTFGVDGQSQTFSSNLPQGQTFSGNPNQGQPINRSPPQGLVFAGNPTQGQSFTGNPSPSQSFGGNPSQTFSSNPVLDQAITSSSQGFQNARGPVFNPTPPAFGTPLISNEPRGQGFSGSQSQPVNTGGDFPSTGRGTSQAFGGSFPAPSQDISKMNPVLSQQGRFPQGLPSRNPNIPPAESNRNFMPSGRTNQLNPQRGMDQQTGIPQGPRSQTNNFRQSSNINSGPQRRFDTNLQTRRQPAAIPRSRVDSFDRQSIDLRPRDRSFGTTGPRDRAMPDGLDFSGPRGPSSRFDGPTRDVPDPRFMDRFDPVMARSDMGIAPGFPEPFSGRDFRSGSRSMGRPDSDLFRPRRGGFSRDFRSRDPFIGRMPDMGPRGMRGFPSGFRRDRDAMMMMMERARRARMRRGF